MAAADCVARGELEGDAHTVSATSVQAAVTRPVQFVQKSQKVVLMPSEYLPTAQAVHMDSWDAPATVLYVPAPHAVHASALTYVEYVPGAQIEHVAACSAEYWPATQLMQDRAVPPSWLFQ